MLKASMSVFPGVVFLLIFMLAVTYVDAVEGGAEPDGAALFASNCSVCHGQTAEGGIGPDIRGKKEGDIRGAIVSFNEMSGIELGDEELHAIEKHLASLK